MTRNWYAVYTQPQKEKKVALALLKKGIENFCPIIKTNNAKLNIKKDYYQPLFNCYVFVFVQDNEVELLKKVPGILNVIYWKSKPAIINEMEIDILKQLTANYSCIKLEKTIVDMNGSVRLIGEPAVAYKENSVSLKYQSLKINLPTLGYNMIAERTKPLEEFIFQESKTQDNFLDFFPKKFNSLFFN